MGNRYAGRAHQLSSLAGRVGPARDAPRRGRPASTEARSCARASGAVHRGGRDGTGNVASV